MDFMVIQFFYSTFSTSTTVFEHLINYLLLLGSDLFLLNKEGGQGEATQWSGGDGWLTNVTPS